jgi:RNA polymerase-binding protein DksA
MLDEQTKQDLKKKLLEEKKSLEEELGVIAEKEDGEYQAEMEDYGREEDDNALEVSDYLSNLSVTESLNKRYEELQAALERLDTEEYGQCENCPGEEIPLERLQANPAARTCIKCQQQEE